MGPPCNWYYEPTGAWVANTLALQKQQNILIVFLLRSWAKAVTDEVVAIYIIYYLCLEFKICLR